MAKPVAIREVRIVNTSTSFNTGFVTANGSHWNATNAVSLRVQSWEPGEKYDSAPDGTLQTRLHGSPYNIPTLRTAGVKFKTYLEGADSGITVNPVANIMAAIMGGTVSSPTSRTLTVSTGSNTTHINFTTSAILSNGMAYLCGSRGDGRGNGEVRSQLSSINANSVILNMALSAAPTAGDTFVCSTTVFLDEDQAQTYIDGMAIGGETQDALQWVGSMGSCKISGTTPGELPSVEFELMAADWREQQGVSMSVAAVSRAGNKPPVERGIGGFFIADAVSSVAPVTRTVMKVGDVEIDPGVTYEKLPDPNGVNGIGGWVRMPSSPKLKFTSIFSEDMPGLYDDFTTPTAKQIICQFGHQAQGCCAVELQRAWLDGNPTRKALGPLAGVEVATHGDEGTANTNGDRERSSIRLHWF